MMIIDLSGRIALVTGGSRGIGFAIARRLLAAGATVVLNSRHIDDSAVAELRATAPEQVHLELGDIAQPESARQLVRNVFSRYKRLDILVNNAGIMRPAMIGMISDEDVQATFDINLTSPIQLIQAAARLMARTGGSIVNVASVVGLEGAPGQLAYAASKAGVVGVTRAAAKELAPKGVRVNAVAPGYIETDMTQHLGDAVRDQSLQSIGLGRAGSPDEVADAVLFLCSDMARYITGQILRVDGGMVI
ncbi:3-oxoacyl-ACP reductase FabG [Sphingobium sufflavum]|jgi:3-oxoacyl-[acyl-carrier protein] reductase|uniref:SDR family NAD(P)-dependent oxidoreductase n=1 Tax=Sphingobium sufflavum TaxID=1129547 RepID=UPI001F245794|nr:3-oxoacyl-ACP reductase family protein [Sphingobium sufflavum]MCE7798736.1 3-oxoacyl-ACP reductase FabG [Sphingobium sufflavum]